MNQSGRIYALEIGTADDGFTIRDLHITFDINKSSDNKKSPNNATIEIYNLSRDHQNILQKPYIYAVFSVGYVATGLYRMFAGEIVNVQTRKSGADVITQIQMGTGYVELNHQLISKFVPDGFTVQDVFKDISATLPSISRNVFTGTNITNPVIDGYPISGTARQTFDAIAAEYDMEWRVDDGVLYVNDIEGTHTKDLSSVFIISQESGLLERPYAVAGDVRRKAKDSKKKQGIQFKCYINAEIVCGGVIRLDYGDISGYYKVTSLRAYGGFDDNDWIMDIRCDKDPIIPNK